MRRRDLIIRLKDESKRLRRVNQSASWSTDAETLQAKFEKRQAVLHSLELLLPEIIEKMEQSS